VSSLSFFKLLRKSKPFIWIEEAEEMFQELKRYRTLPPVMVALEPGEPLLLCITTTAEAVSMVAVAKRVKPQQPQVPKGASAGGSESQDLEPVEEPSIVNAARSQLLEAFPAPDSQVRSQSPKPT
jgi:hypothetical protein